MATDFTVFITVKHDSTVVGTTRVNNVYNVIDLKTYCRRTRENIEKN